MKDIKDFNVFEILKYKEILKSYKVEPESISMKEQIDTFIDNLNFLEMEMIFLFIPKDTLKGILYNFTQDDLDVIYVAMSKAIEKREITKNDR